jgi:hypothetical protein
MPGAKKMTKLDRCVASVMKDGKSEDSAYAICQASISGKTGKTKKSIEHRGVTFPGYNKPRKSTRPGKKKMVLAKQGDKVKVIHYGDTDYKHNYSAEAKKNFRARHRCSEQKDKLSAAYWACKDLWPSGSTKKAVKEMKDDPCWEGYEMVGHKMKDGKKVPNCVPKSTKKSGSFLMKKIEVNNNETYTIKGVNGETYVFHNGDLFIDSPEMVTATATILKSLRTQQGAESWLKLAGKKYDNAVIMDTESLIELLGTMKASLPEMPSLDKKMPFHVVAVEGMEDMSDIDADDEMEALEMESGESEEAEELMEDEEQEQEMSMTQIAQVLHDAQKLYDMIKDDEHLEPWMQTKLTKVAEYMNALAENLEHGDGDIPADDDAVKVDVDVDSMPGLPPLPGYGVEETEEEDINPVKELPDMPEDVKDDEEDKKSVPVEPVMMSTKKNEVPGKVFKSLHAARQWNRFENPDKERYYIDIMREKDARKGYSKSTGLNAKYIVRDRHTEDASEEKGAYGNKKVQKGLPPVKNIDAETLRVAAIKE